MVFAVDIGNTHIVMGCIDRGEIVHVARMTTDLKKTEYEYAVAIKSIFELNGISFSGFDGAIISSVALSVTDSVKKAVKILTGQDPLVVGAGIKTGLNIRIDDPATTGSDIVVAAVAALSKYKPPLIIIDLGTATTMAVVDTTSSFIGGVIIPGVGLSMQALASGTSQLPKIAIEPPRKCIGTNTIDCMKSGSVFGTAAMMDGMIDRIEGELGMKATVIATGGLSHCIIPYCRHEITCDDDLLLTGLWLIHEKNRKK